MKINLAIVVGIFMLVACAPQTGSEKWCERMKEKPKVDWTANEASDFARHCVFK